MKIRCYLVDLTRGDPLKRYLLRDEPAGIVWASYHYPQNGGNTGLVIVAAEDGFDWSPLAAVEGAWELPQCKLYTRLDVLSEDKRTAFREAFEDRFGPLDEMDIEDYEDLICHVLRANGETGRRKLRHTESQRTREFLDAFDD